MRLWLFSLGVENITVAMAALFFAVSLHRAPAGVMAVLAFYVLARMSGSITGIIEAGSAGTSSFVSVTSDLMNLILSFIPRFDLFAQGNWLLYGAEGSSIGYDLIVLQGGVFCAIVLSAATVDFLGKQL